MCSLKNILTLSRENVRIKCSAKMSMTDCMGSNIINAADKKLGQVYQPGVALSSRLNRRRIR